MVSQKLNIQIKTNYLFNGNGYIVVAEFKNLIMNIEREIRVRDAIKYCIENFDSKTATNRIVEFWKDELKLQEQAINYSRLCKSDSEQLVCERVNNHAAVMHWVAVSERLPNDYQRVLVGRAGEANVMKVLTYKKEFDNKHWGDSMESHFASPTHWMPLPEPPCY